MTTRRLLVSIEEHILSEIQELARINKKSSSSIALELIKSSLELQEDKLFSKIADDRIVNTNEWVSHEDAWK